MSDFKKLLVWRKAHALAMNIHRAAGQMRRSHYTSLRSQMIRAAMSISTNLVEGCGQQSRREFGRFIRDALSSQAAEVRKMLHGLLNRVLVSPRRAEMKAAGS